MVLNKGMVLLEAVVCWRQLGVGCWRSLISPAQKMEQKENGSDLHVLTLQTNMQVSLFYKISVTAAIFYHLSLKEKRPILLPLKTSH
jgi:hypothetical protein